MSEDLTDEQFADLRRQQAARQERQQLEAYELYLEEQRQREADEEDYTRQRMADLAAELIAQEQRGQGS